MGRRSLFVIISSFLFAAVLGLVFFTLHVFARRTVKDLSSSQNGSTTSPSSGDCSDNFPTPFVAVLNGQVIPTDPNSSNPPACTNFLGTGPYPDYTLSLAAGNSFTLTVTPVIWGGGDPANTILHLEFSSTNPNLSLQSFVIGNLPATNPGVNPSFVACDFGQGVPPTPHLFLLPAAIDNNNHTLTACTRPTMELPLPAGDQPPTLGFASAIQPTPIQFADTTTNSTTVRWDIAGLKGSSPLLSPLPSVDLFVAGLPSDLIGQLVFNGATPASNNLTSALMKNHNNFLAVAFDSSANTTVFAGGLSIPNLPTSAPSAPVNDSFSSPTTVDPTMAISQAGFMDQVNIAGATPEENPDGTPSTNPGDPLVPGACFGAGQADSSVFRTVWYSFTPIGNGTMTIDTSKSRFDSVVAVYTGTPNTLTPLSGACDDNFVDANKITHLQAKVSNVQVTRGTEYFILVGESPTQTGLLNDSTTGDPVVPNQTVAAPLSNDATLFFSVVETPTPAAIDLSPSSGTALSFGNQQVGAPSSQPQEVTITSNGGTPLTISNIAVPMANGFSVTTTCNSPVPQGSSCKIDVSWTPNATGAVPANSNLTFTDNATGSPSQSFPLTGTGVDYTFPTPATTTGTLTSTNNATYNLTVNGSAGFSNTVTLACSSLPTNTQCNFNPPSPETPGSNSLPVTLTVSRISTTAGLISPSVLMQASGGLAALLLLFLRGRRRKTAVFATYLVVLVLLAGSAGFLASCNNTQTVTPPPVPPSPGNYQFSVTATSSGVAKPINLTLQVQ